MNSHSVELLGYARLRTWQDVTSALMKLKIWRDGLVSVSSTWMSQEVIGWGRRTGAE